MGLNQIISHLSQGMLAAALLGSCMAPEEPMDEDVGKTEMVDKIPYKRGICRDMTEDVEYNMAVDSYFNEWNNLTGLLQLPEGWDVWMKVNKGEGLNNNHDRFCRTFYLSKDLDKNLTMVVDIYQDPSKVYLDSSWAGSDKHLSLLERFFEFTYPNWNLTLTSVIGMEQRDKEEVMKENQVRLYLGYPGASHTEGSQNIYVHYDPIVGHELAHILSLGHHYPSKEHMGENWFAAPGELMCIMDRTWNQFGSPERFALGIPLNVDNKQEIEDLASILNSKYVDNY